MSPTPVDKLLVDEKPKNIILLSSVNIASISLREGPTGIIITKVKVLCVCISGKTKMEYLSQRTQFEDTVSIIVLEL